MVINNLWNTALAHIKENLTEKEFNTWIRPLTTYQEDYEDLQIYAPNRFILDWVKSKYLDLIKQTIFMFTGNKEAIKITFKVGIAPPPKPPKIEKVETQEKVEKPKTKAKVKIELENELNNFINSDDQDDFAQTNIAQNETISKPKEEIVLKHKSNLKSYLNFANFVQGKTNQLAFVAAEQVAINPKSVYNPLFIYGASGLGKTHLMQAIGNQMRKNNPNAKVVYLTSERFVGDMVSALKNNAINEFKHFYRSLDALLIDDIQFFAHKERSQEEFFHTFNALLEEGQQVVLTCDRFPKELDGIEDRLKSRAGWGLTVHVEPPDLETRVAILLKKAAMSRVHLGNEEAFFIAERLFSNVRELEGALRKIYAHAELHGQKITISVISEALKDLFAVQDRMVSIENIQRIVVNHYQIKMADLFSKRRSRSVARPRQVAMALTKELTSHSLPEIGAAFGGRDHTTVLHAVRKITQLCKEDTSFNDNYEKLKRSLTA